MTRPTESPTDEPVVIGGSLGGIFAAAALSVSGWTVTQLERDRLPAAAGCLRTGRPTSAAPRADRDRRPAVRVPSRAAGWRRGAVRHGSDIPTTSSPADQSDRLPQARRRLAVCLQGRLPPDGAAHCAVPPGFAARRSSAP